MLSYTRFDPKRNPFPTKKARPRESPAAGAPGFYWGDAARHSSTVTPVASSAENLHIALPLLGHGVGAVLAHPAAVAKAGDGKGKGIPGQRHVKDAERREKICQAWAPETVTPADGDGVDAPALVRSMVPHPAGGSPIQAGRGLGFQGKSLNSWVVRVTWLIVGHALPQGSPHSEIGHAVAPDSTASWWPRWRRREDRVDELPLVENDLVARLRHGSGDFIGVLRRLVPPVALGLVPAIQAWQQA